MPCPYVRKVQIAFFSLFMHKDFINYITFFFKTFPF